MLHFESDYLEGAHPKILERLIQTNLEQTPGYGLDPYCEGAREKIRLACHAPQAQIYFLSGGTQTNALVIKTLLRPVEGVLSADTGHIHTHEAGAVEAGGHKILTLKQTFGKIGPQDVAAYMDDFRRDGNRSHRVRPGMVYISHPTEYGALYSGQELADLSRICRQNKLLLYLDGARLGYALAAQETDVTLQDIAASCDAFYIGGTKVGALLGEALVITRPELAADFFAIIKQNGALLAKGRILGIQFDVLFTDGLYLKTAAHAIAMAEKLKQGLWEKGCRFFYASPTNQQFLIVENKRLKELAQQAAFSFWQKLDEQHTVIRLATSWATRESDVDELIRLF